MKNIVLFLFSILLAGCSLLSDREVLQESEKSPDEAKIGEVVPKYQYDELLNKYESLQKEIEEKRGGQNVDPQSEEIIEKIAKIGEDSLPVQNAPLVTVDAFQESKPLTINEQGNSPQTAIGDGEVHDEISKLNGAIKLLGQGKMDEAMRAFKALEESQIPQVRVRSKFYIGELLFMQKEYNLAMQVFEDIISNHAHSGVTLDALGRLIKCSEELKLKEKHDQYFSMLHDFFEG